MVKTNQRRNIKLLRKEKISLLMDAIIMIILLLAIDFTVFFITKVYYTTHRDWPRELINVGNSLMAGNHIQLWNWNSIFIIMVVALNAFALAIRLLLHYKRIQQHHIIRDLYYIADGNLNYTIPYQLIGEEQKLVDSINALVNNVIQSMSEELKAERSKDELISNVSHDIRTPLTSIIGYLGLVEHHQDHNDEELRHYVHIAYEKANQMKVLTDYLFEYTNLIDRDASTLTTRPVEMKAMLDQIAAGFDLASTDRQMELITRTNFATLSIDANPDDLARAIENLINNALKYGNDGHHIYLTGRQVDSRELQIMVSNDGEPIPAEALGHVFERFYRVESSRNRLTGGNGLGLAIVSEIAKLHGGYCSVTSTDALTTFTIHLPINHNEPLKQHN